jgi:hypothetical protein
LICRLFLSLVCCSNDCFGRNIARFVAFAAKIFRDLSRFRPKSFAICRVCGQNLSRFVALAADFLRNLSRFVALAAERKV